MLITGIIGVLHRTQQRTLLLNGTLQPGIGFIFQCGEMAFHVFQRTLHDFYLTLHSGIVITHLRQ